ncbi:MAG: heme exporter protein CcmD [Alteromonadaceae bacterium]|nr:heme exporter protein CcmD [Alteromonadaceae bacterium]
MQFDSISDFFNMGGYAFFVWLAYGATAVMLALLVISSNSSFKKMKQQIAQRQKRETKLRQAAQLQRTLELEHDQQEQQAEKNNSKEVLS